MGFDDIVTTKELAHLLNKTEITILRWAIKGKIPAKKIGRTWFYNKREILEFLSSKKD